MKVRSVKTLGRSAPKTARPAAAVKRTSEPAFTIKTILAPLDFSKLSDPSLKTAEALARLHSAKLLLLHVVEPILYPVDYLLVPPVMEEGNANMAQAVKDRLQVLVDDFRSKEIACEAFVKIGKPFKEIVDVAREQKADLILLPTHGFTGLKHVYLGSTAEKVARHAPCSVLIIR